MDRDTIDGIVSEASETQDAENSINEGKWLLGTVAMFAVFVFLIGMSAAASGT
ncbi:MAG: hypothetical protein AAF423_10685 [Pseudomonadota bacterium]